MGGSPGRSPPPLRPPRSTSPPGTRALWPPLRCPGFSGRIWRWGHGRLWGRTGRWGGGREEVWGLPGRVKEVAQNEEAPRAGRVRRFPRPALLLCHPTDAPDPRPLPRHFDPTPPRPRLTCAGRCGARSSRSARGNAESLRFGAGEAASRERGPAPLWPPSRCPGSTEQGRAGPSAFGKGGEIDDIVRIEAGRWCQLFS